MGAGMTSEFIIAGRMPGLNEYTKKNRNNWHAGARMKRRETERAAWSAKAAHVPQFHKPVRISFLWVEPNRRRDRDNVAFAKKFILDGLKDAGIIRDDGPDYVVDLVDEWDYDKEYPRIVVTITDEV